MFHQKLIDNYFTIRYATVDMQYKKPYVFEFPTL